MLEAEACLRACLERQESNRGDFDERRKSKQKFGLPLRLSDPSSMMHPMMKNGVRVFRWVSKQ